MGRHYYFWDTSEPGDIYSHAEGTDLDKFEKAGSGTDLDKCSHFVGTAAKWVMEILLDRGAIINNPISSQTDFALNENLLPREDAGGRISM